MSITTIALLRGINVGGHTVKMERLRALFGDLGLANVRSYIQSGNVFFDSDETDRGQLAARIERHLAQELGFEAPVFLRTVSELEHLLALAPFAGREVTPTTRFAVTFTSDALAQDWELPLFSPKRDLEIVGVTTHEAFIVWHLQDGRPPTEKFLTSITGSRTTTRFYHTLQKILAAAQTR